MMRNSSGLDIIQINIIAKSILGILCSLRVITKVPKNSTLCLDFLNRQGSIKIIKKK